MYGCNIHIHSYIYIYIFIYIYVCVCVCVCVRARGLVSLFNGISIVEGYLMPKIFL